MHTSSLPSKPHYPILDGLRGVAALTVVIFHLLEAHSTSHLDLMINHGYLAVDFFFLLSGFVIGYAYDDRWDKMSTEGFFKRRLVRLQPMLIMGMVVGAICFYFQASNYWPMIAQIPVWQMLLVMLLGFTMLPLPVPMDIRGWAEMHPLNGPAWSLFYEYIANILYALVVRRFSSTALTILVILSAAALIHLGLTNPFGDVIGGWSLDATQIHIGTVRMLYPFFAGLLLFRLGKLANIKNAFLLSSILLLIVFAMPRIGGATHLWLNGLYDSLSIILIFPLIVFLAASGEVTGKVSSRICKFLGDISYPIYITHYPIIYIYTAWVIDNKIPLAQALPIGLFAFLFCVVLAYSSLKLYDEPVRLWLKKKILDN